MPKIRISENFCKGCKICVEMCPMNVLGLSKNLTLRGIYIPEIINPDKCTGCRICEHYCPDFAIYVEEEEVTC